MEWVKQNVKFVVGIVVSLLAIGGAGYFAYAQYTSFTNAQAAMNDARSQWEGLERKSPHPGTSSVNNIRSATNDLANVSGFYNQTIDLFQPVPEIAITNAFQLNVTINQSIALLTKTADQSGVTIPNNYNFTFRGQKELIDFDDNASIPKFAFHLGNVQKLVNAIYNSRVHSLESIKRVKVDDTDAESFGIMNNLGMTQEEYLLYTPYEISFKGFSSELASVIENLTNSKDVYIIKAMNVEPTELPIRPQENRKIRRTIIRRPNPTSMNPYGANPYGEGRAGSAMANTYGGGSGNNYGSGRTGSAMSNTYGGGSGNPYGSSGNPMPPRGGNPYGVGPGSSQYGGNPYGGQYGMMPGYGMGPQQPQIRTRKNETSDKYVIAEKPLLFQVQVHLVNYFDDTAVVEKVFSSGESDSSEEGEDDYNDDYDDDQY